MFTPQAMNMNEVMDSIRLNRLLDRAGRFLRATGINPLIMGKLMELGFSEKEQQEGWELLMQASGYNSVSVWVGEQLRRSPNLQRLAMEALGQWDGEYFLRAEAALQRLFPEQCDYLFRGLEAGDGVQSVIGVQLFLDRVDTLRDGTNPERTQTREADQQAVELLVQRNILSPEIEKQLREWLKYATQAAAPPQVSMNEDELQQAARKLKAWYDDWATTARASITRRDYLIQLGLAKRRVKKSAANEQAELAEPAAPTTDAIQATPASEAQEANAQPDSQESQQTPTAEAA